MRTRSLVCLVALGLAVAVRPAAAQTGGGSLGAPNDPAAARAQLEAGYALKEQGKYADALPHFQESLRLDVQLKTLTNLADCEEHLGKLVDAQKHWVMARDRAGVEQNDRLRAAADEKLSALEKRMPKLTIRLAPGSPGGAQVARDGTALGSISLGLPLPTDPGAHTLVVHAPGHLDATTTATVAEGELKEVVLAAGPDAPEQVDVVAAETRASSSLGAQKIAAVTAAGLGGVGLVVGTIFGVAAISSWGNAQADCQSGCLPGSKAQDERSSAVTSATASTVGFIAGATLLAGGATLWLLTPKRSEARPAPSATPPATAALGVSPAPGGLLIRGAF